MEQGGPSIVSSCERLAAEADGRILLGTSTNRTSGAGWGCEKRCPLQKKSKIGGREMCVVSCSSARGFDKSHREGNKRSDRVTVEGLVW